MNASDAHQDDATTLRTAAQLLRDFDDAGVKELALAHHLDDCATSLDAGRPVLQLDLAVTVARAVIVFGGAR